MHESRGLSRVVYPDMGEWREHDRLPDRRGG